MLFVQPTPTRDSTSELLDALRNREVDVFGHSTPGKTRTPNEGNGTPKRNIFLGKIADRGAEGATQHQQHFTNPFSSASPRDILHVGNVGELEELVRCFSAAQQQQHSSRGGGDVELLFWSQHPGSNQNAK